MSKEELEHLKTAGAHHSMGSAISSKLWEARRLLDESTADAYQNFEKKIERARTLIDDAVQIRNEMQWIPKAKK